MRLFSTTSSILTSLFLIAMTGTFGACSAPDVCDDSIDVGSLSINPQGSPCTYKCECNNQLYEGFCKDDGSCQSLPRESCRVPGKKRACIPLKLDDSGCKDGIQICQPPELGGRSLWGDCKPLVPTKESGKELCQDGLDNDCDGKTDLGDPECKDICNPGKFEPCFGNEDKTLQGIGICKQGLRYCREDATWGACEGQQLPQQEVCDGQDNDCNGKVDELDECKCWPPTSKETCYSGDSATKGKGVCVAGQRICLSNGQWSACEGEITPQKEDCNGKDDDCNGQVDELDECQCWPPLTKETCYTGDSATKGKGECRAGERTCQLDGTWGSCEGQQLPQAKDICNGKDDDCNGSIDDNSQCECWPPYKQEPCYTGPKGTQSKGICRAGVRSCQLDGTWTTCEGEIHPQAKETCNGKDDNCDGKVDELDECKCWPPQQTQPCYTGPKGTQSQGPCASGTQSCQANGTWGACIGQQLPQAEECNLKDDDCDGQIDNTSGGSLNSLTRSCYSGQSGCTLQNGKYTCLGACKAGTQQCFNGNWSACQGESVTQAEECNGKDDDCDGVIDEDADLINAPSCLNQRGDCKGATTPARLCQNGRWLPCDDNAYKAHFSAYSTKDESCDQKDNNCNGQIDEYAVNCVAILAGSRIGAVDEKGTAAQFGRPEKLAKDTAGRVYIIDASNKQLRRMDQCGNVETISGNTNPNTNDGLIMDVYYNDLKDVVLEKTDDYLLLDGAKFRRFVSPDNISTLQEANYTSMSGLLYNQTLGFYARQAQTGRIFNIQASDGKQIKEIHIAPKPSSFSPDAWTSDTTHFYIADNQSAKIYKVTSSGVLTTFAGSGTKGYLDGAYAQARFSDMKAMAFDSKGQLYIIDGHRIRRLSNGQVTTVSGSTEGFAMGSLSAAKFSSPSGILVDADDNVLIADTGNVRLRRLNITSPTVQPVACVLTLAGSLRGSQSGLRNGPQQQALFRRPRNVTLDKNGHLYVTDTANAQVRKLDISRGLVTTFAGSRFGIRDGDVSIALFRAPIDGVFDSKGNYFLVDIEGHAVRKIDTKGNVTTFSKGTTKQTFAFPTGITIDQDDNLYVIDNNHHKIIHITPSGIATTFAGSGGRGMINGPKLSAQFATPEHITFGPDGSLYISETGNHSIRKIDPSGKVTTFAGTGNPGYKDGPAQSAQFNHPRGLAFDHKGNLFVADAFNHRIRKIDSSGNVTTFAGTGNTTAKDGPIYANQQNIQFHRPSGLLFDKQGQLYLVEEFTNKLRKITFE